jgi:hypothetical protein
MEEASAVRNFSWAGHSTQLAAALRRNMTAGGADLLLSCQVIATNFLPYLAWLSFVPLCFLLVFILVVQRFPLSCSKFYISHDNVKKSPPLFI